MTFDRARFNKLMMMTTSPVDAEALIAIRKANAMLKVAGLTWDHFFVNKSQQPVVRKPSKPSKPSGRGVFDVKI